MVEAGNPKDAVAEDEERPAVADDGERGETERGSWAKLFQRTGAFHRGFYLSTYGAPGTKPNRID